MCPTTATGNGRRSAIELDRPDQNLPCEPTPLSQGRSAQIATGHDGLSATSSRIRVSIFAQNQLVREALRRSLIKFEQVHVIGGLTDALPGSADRSKEQAQVSVLFSRDEIQADLEQIEAIRKRTPATKILLVGSAKEDIDFLQYVRAGINGYLWREASAEDIAQGILNVQAGKAVCPGELCAVLFRFFESSEPRLPFGSPTQRLGLTRREQQIVPLIAKGFTNKEIANHFCLSEQTVKNHLYRMKHKIGADDRLSIVQKFRHHGLLL